ncbi:MAG: homocysteine S-methyltransferase [Gemmatimonadetes bacterium]|nr:homocysteine S-methyltransferase [Gemmatimonadota bacterium]
MNATVPMGGKVRLLGRPAPLVLDGGSATALEAEGYVHHPTLWSGGAIFQAPQAVRRVHRAFLDAGADIISTVGYQASFAALLDAGFGRDEASDLIRLGVELAVTERDAFVAERSPAGRSPPLVAASVGPYGAWLPDGLEYDGRYGVDADELTAFHLPGLEALVESRADLLAFDTVPSLLEIEVIANLIRETRARAWISFSCRDEDRLADGTLIEEAITICEGAEGIVALGANCVPPGIVLGLVERMVRASSLPVIVYPNRGAGFGADAYGRGTPLPSGRGRTDACTLAPRWIAAGAAAVGGCCGIGPGEVREIAVALGR